MCIIKGSGKFKTFLKKLKIPLENHIKERIISSVRQGGKAMKEEIKRLEKRRADGKLTQEEQEKLTALILHFMLQ